MVRAKDSQNLRVLCLALSIRLCVRGLCATAARVCIRLSCPCRQRKQIDGATGRSRCLPPARQCPGKGPNRPAMPSTGPARYYPCLHPFQRRLRRSRALPASWALGPGTGRPLPPRRVGHSRTMSRARTVSCVCARACPHVPQG